MFRAVAIIAQASIAHGEELYVDYLQDERTEHLDYTPDWLIEPPPASPFLEKKEITSKVPFLVKMLYSYKTAKLGKKYEEFEARTTKELPVHQ